jgi:hypothetical protein
VLQAAGVFLPAGRVVPRAPDPRWVSSAGEFTLWGFSGLLGTLLLVLAAFSIGAAVTRRPGGLWFTSKCSAGLVGLSLFAMVVDDDEKFRVTLLAGGYALFLGVALANYAAYKGLRA